MSTNDKPAGILSAERLAELRRVVRGSIRGGSVAEGDAALDAILAHVDALTPPPVASPVELDLEAIEARRNAATPGPLIAVQPRSQDGGQAIAHFGPSWSDTFPARTSVRLPESGAPPLTWEQHERNADFHAHAWEDTRALVAEVRRLRAINTGLLRGTCDVHEGGLRPIGRCDRCKRFASLTGYAMRTDEEEAEVHAIAAWHKSIGVDTGWTIVPRESIDDAAAALRKVRKVRKVKP